MVVIAIVFVFSDKIWFFNNKNFYGLAFSVSINVENSGEEII